MFSRAFFSALVAAGVYLANAGPLVVRDDPVCARSYTVVPGDTCDAISVVQNVSTHQLAVNNPTVNTLCTNLWVGQVLCLGFAGHDCTTLHQVIEGDSCSVILSNANITLPLLIANNPNVDSGCANIYPGEVLCTANTTIYATS